MYINDIVKDVKCGIRLFADDSILHMEFDDSRMAANQLNEDLNNMAAWAKQWLVKFSPEKTKTMCISLKTNSTATDFPLLYNNVMLEEVNEHKHLGIILNDKLKWSDHINSVIESIKKLTDVFRHLKYKLDRKTLESIYLTFVRPKLEYGSILFDDCTEQDKIRLENVQLNFARTISGAKKGTSHEAIYKKTTLPKLDERRKKQQLKFIHRIVHNNAPPYLNNLLPEPNENNYNLRNNHEQKQFKFKTARFQKSLLPDCVSKWNELDVKIRQIPDNLHFKNCITNQNVPNPLHYGHERALGIIHSQLRMKCSNLKAHLFSLHVVDSPHCVCMGGIEDCFHFFFKCPLYISERNKLFDNVQHICDVSLEVLLNGKSTLSLDKNCEITRHVETYISDTARFAR